MPILTKTQMLEFVEQLKEAVQTSDDNATFEGEISRQDLEIPGGDGHGWQTYAPSPFVTIKMMRRINPVHP